MIVQFSVYPMGVEHMSGDMRQIEEILKGGGVDHQLGPIGTCVQGDWDLVLPTIKKCHEAIRAHHGRVITTIIIDDHKDKEHSLAGAVASVFRHEAQASADH